MNEKKYVLNTLLAMVVGLFLLGTVIARTCFPAIILPEANIPNLVLLSLIALVLDHYLAPEAKRCYICIPVFSAITFGLFSFVSAYATLGEAVKLAIAGGIVFTATTWLFTSAQDRISSGPRAKAAPIGLAMGLYLAAQCFAGMIL